MKKSVTSALAIAVTLTGLALGSAVSAGNHPPKLPSFSALDQNSDGAITLDEIKAFGSAQFTKTDTNGDGFLDADELLAAAKTHRGGKDRPVPDADNVDAMVANLMQRGDSNGDGMISPDEAKGRFAENFDKIDSNADGSIDADELKAALLKRGEAMANRPAPQERIARLIARADADGDGMLNRDEATPPKSGRMFDKLDTNGDGSVTKAEWDAGMAKRPAGN